MITEEPKPEDPTTEDPRPNGLDRPMNAQLETQLDQEKTEAKLTREIQIKIGQQLRAMYMDVVDQGIPQRFVELLQHLDKGADEKGEE